MLEENGIDLGLLKKIKNVRRQRISEYARCTEARLASIMCGIHDTCFQTAEEYGAPGNCVLGANIAGIVRVAESMRMLGVI